MSDPKIIDWKARAESAEAERDALVSRLERALAEGAKRREERDALAAHVVRLRAGLHQALVHWGAHCPEEDGAAYAECERRCDEAPEASLTKLKANWQAKALQDLFNQCAGQGMIRRGVLLDKAIELQEDAEEAP